MAELLNSKHRCLDNDDASARKRRRTIQAVKEIVPSDNKVLGRVFQDHSNENAEEGVPPNEFSVTKSTSRKALQSQQQESSHLAQAKEVFAEGYLPTVPESSLRTNSRAGHDCSSVLTQPNLSNVKDALLHSSSTLPYPARHHSILGKKDNTKKRISQHLANDIEENPDAGNTSLDYNTFRIAHRPKPGVTILDTTSPAVRHKIAQDEILWHLTTLRKQFDHLEEKMKTQGGKTSLRAKKGNLKDDDNDDDNDDEDFGPSPPVKQKKGYTKNASNDGIVSDDAESAGSGDSYVYLSTSSSDESEQSIESFIDAYDLPSRDEIRKLSAKKLLKLVNQLYDIAEDLYDQVIEEKGINETNALRTNKRRLPKRKPSIDLLAWAAEELEERARTKPSWVEKAQYDFLLEKIKELTKANIDFNEKITKDESKANRKGKRKAPTTYLEKMEALNMQHPKVPGVKILHEEEHQYPLVNEEIAFALLTREKQALKASQKSKKDEVEKDYLLEDLSLCTIPSIPTFGKTKPDLSDRTRTKEFYKLHFEKLMHNLGLWVEKYFAPNSRENIPLNNDKEFPSLFVQLIKSTKYWRPETFLLRSTEFVVENAPNGSDKRQQKRLELYKAVLYAYIYNDFFEKWIVGLNDTDKDAARTHLSLYIEDLWTPRGIRARAHYCISSLSSWTSSFYEEVLNHQLKESHDRLMDIFKPLVKFTCKPNKFDDPVVKLSCERQLFILLSECQALARMLNMEPCLYRVAWPLQSQEFNSMYMVDVEAGEKAKNMIKKLWTRATSNQLVDYSLVPGLWFVQEVVIESKEGNTIKTENKETIEEALVMSTVAVLDV